MENNTNTHDLALDSNTWILLLSLEPQEWFDIKLEQGWQGSPYLYHNQLYINYYFSKNFSKTSKILNSQHAETGNGLFKKNIDSVTWKFVNIWGNIVLCQTSINYQYFGFLNLNFAHNKNILLEDWFFHSIG